jgi:UPF0755 protein
VLRFMIQTLKVAAIFVLAVTVIFTSQRAMSHYMTQSSAADQDDVVRFVVQEDETVESVAQRLEEAELIRSGFYFRMRMRLTSTDAQLKAGQFDLRRSMTVNEIIDELTTSATAGVVDVRFQEGWRTEQYADQLVEVGLIETPEEFIEAIENGVWNYDFLETRPSGALLEGYLFPDTYQFRSDATPEDIIHTLLQTFEQRVTPEMRAQAADLGYNFHNVMVIASIVEREAVVAEERSVIASVFYNRLDTGMPLQADPTVQYAVGEPGNWWPQVTQADLDRAAPHNTYQRPGIPPWPICNPGLATIQATLEPADTDYMFFVVTNDGTGSHAFAETYEEHQQNIIQARENSQ